MPLAFAAMERHNAITRHANAGHFDDFSIVDVESDSVFVLLHAIIIKVARWLLTVNPKGGRLQIVAASIRDVRQGNRELTRVNSLLRASQ